MIENIDLNKNIDEIELTNEEIESNRIATEQEFERRAAKRPKINLLDISLLMYRQMLCECCISFDTVPITDFKQLKNYKLCKCCFIEKKRNISSS